jgi:hypothetical protein
MPPLRQLNMHLQSFTFCFGVGGSGDFGAFFNSLDFVFPLYSYVFPMRFLEFPIQKEFGEDQYALNINTLLSHNLCPK